MKRRTLSLAALALMQNKELTTLDQDPLSLQAYVVKREQGGYVLTKDVEVRYGLKRAVAFYTLQGQRISAPLHTLPQGVYIVGGKKVIK